MPLVLVIYNPVCGARTAESLTKEHILPLLEQQNITVEAVIPTEYAGHAGVLVGDYMERSTTDLVIILASGDGTLHEIVSNYTPPSHNSLQSPPKTSPTIRPRVSLVLVPAGTANSMYSSFFPPVKGTDISTVEYKLQSVHAFLDGKSSVPLTLAVTTLFPSPGDSQADPRTVVSAVVTSTSLHASILYDSEELRKEYPGIERFKVAAQRNGQRWYHATAKLMPGVFSGAVQIYEPISGKFVNHPEWTIEKPVVEVKGPFIYFLCTVNVDRLEPEFKIAPLARTVPSEGSTLDIVIVRPLRDPSIDREDEEGRAGYVEKIWKVMQGAYADGGHIGSRYDERGEVGSEGTGEFVVEYIRCGGWEWIPGEEDERAGFVCADGDMLRISHGGKGVSWASTPDSDTGFGVYG